MTAAIERTRWRRRRGGPSGAVTREGETERGDGLRAREGREHQTEEETGKLRESEVKRRAEGEKRRTDQQISPKRIPPSAAVIQAAHREKKAKRTRHCPFFFFLKAFF